MDGGVWQITRSVIIILHLLLFCTCYLHSRSQKAHKFSHVCVAAPHTVSPHPIHQEYKSHSIFLSAKGTPSFLERGNFSSQRCNRTTAKWNKSATPYLCLVISAGCAQWRHCLVTPEDPNFLQLILPCPTTCAQGLLFSGLGNFHSSLGETLIRADLELLMTAVNREPTVIVPLLVSLPQFPLTAFASTPVNLTLRQQESK